VDINDAANSSEQHLTKSNEDLDDEGQTLIAKTGAASNKDSQPIR